MTLIEPTRCLPCQLQGLSLPSKKLVRGLRRKEDASLPGQDKYSVLLHIVDGAICENDEGRLAVELEWQDWLVDLAIEAMLESCGYSSLVLKASRKDWKDWKDCIYNRLSTRAAPVTASRYMQEPILGENEACTLV